MELPYLFPYPYWEVSNWSNVDRRTGNADGCRSCVGEGERYGDDPIGFRAVPFLRHTAVITAIPRTYWAGKADRSRPFRIDANP